ncbi:MAG: L-fucose:H+ symporter permease [Bacteroidetes bacterium]|nr:L-fucose:H+ symporter permease [Bacteroidota bacterium]
MKQKNLYLFPFILITILFFLWGFAHNLNPILIPHLKKACQLSDLESALIDSAFFVGYFVMALPAGFFMKKYGYKYGIIFGLLLFAGGAFLFVPAANTRAFAVFLFALFVIASGLTFLETAANPYVTVLGDSHSATQRLNFSQSFNGLAASLAPLMGGIFILSGKTLTESQKSGLSEVQLDQYLLEEAASVKIPYIAIGIVVLLVAVFIWRTNLPEIDETEHASDAQTQSGILKNKNLVLGVLAQFFYVGAQVCVGSFFLVFAATSAGLSDKEAATYTAFYGAAFMIGRFAGTFFMKYIKPVKLLAIYAVINILLSLIAIYGKGMITIYSLIGIAFFMSIMFPTIFALGINGLGNATKPASSLIIMSIVGGAVLPPILGIISDKTGSIQDGYFIPFICFIVVLLFALKMRTIKKEILQ